LKNTKFIKLSKNEYELNEFSFVEDKLKNLTSIWKFRFSCPWFVPT